MKSNIIGNQLKRRSSLEDIERIAAVARVCFILIERYVGARAYTRPLLVDLARLAVTIFRYCVFLRRSKYLLMKGIVPRCVPRQRDARVPPPPPRPAPATISGRGFEINTTARLKRDFSHRRSKSWRGKSVENNFYVSHTSCNYDRTDNYANRLCVRLYLS